MYRSRRLNDVYEPSLRAATRIVAGDDGTVYDGVAIALHWTTAMLVIVQFALGQTWDWFAKPTREFMENTHMSFGVLLTVVILARLVWRLDPRPSTSRRSKPAGCGSRRRRRIICFMRLLVIEAVLGFTFRWGAGRPMDFFGLSIPPLIGQMAKPVTHNLKEIHDWVGWAIIVIALVHALVALYHHYVLKDRVLVRMLPRGARPYLFGRDGLSAGEGAGLSSRKQRFTNTKNNGTKKIARKVADKVPPTTARPIAFWLPAPGPVAIASGSTPKTKAKLVIMIGRSRTSPRRPRIRRNSRRRASAPRRIRR